MANSKKPMGRPELPINWDLVDDLLICGCTGGEIASHFDIHPQTLYDRTLLKYGVQFSTYSYEKRQKGESILRAKQYKKAIGKTEDGDNTLLIWLGKNRLNQKEAPQEVSVNKETLTQFESLMGLMRSNQSSSQRSIDDNSINSDAKSE